MQVFSTRLALLFPRYSFVLAGTGLMLLASPLGVSAQTPANKFMGTGTCSSSNCHGSEKAVNTYNIMQNEFVTWQRKDKHSQAWSILLNDESKRIAYHLKIGAPEKEPLCLKCHSTYVPDGSLHGEKFMSDDGVSCESCHGAAEHYLEPHTAKDATHEQNLKNGMTDLVDTRRRAELCLSCHFGDGDKVVDHRLIGAGHPRLRFELDTFAEIMPRHWDVDDDYKKRKGDYQAARAWLTGQVMLSVEMMEKLGDSARAHAGGWPELTLFNCYTCHHDLTPDQWKSRDYGGRPGELRLNLSSLLIVREAMKVLDNKLASDLQARITALEDAYRLGKADEEISSLKALLVSDARSIADKRGLDDQTLDRLLRQMLQFGSSSGYPSYETAEQVAMAITSILSQRGSAGRAYQDNVNSLFQSLGNADQFDPPLFTKACAEFLRKVGA